MSFLKMAINNMKRKSENYLTYFLSTTFAVVIFFIFCAIYYNPEFNKFHEIGTKMGIIFKIAIVVVLIFSGVFVYYANSLFVKERKKEIAIYSLLGMKKREIAKLLFYETLIVGMGAVLCGALIGSIFSRLFSMGLIKLILAGAPGNDIGFTMTWHPYVLSIVLFSGLFLLNALSSMKMIYKSKLIELLSAEKEGEAAPKFSIIASFLAIACIGIAYTLFLGLNGNDGAMQIVKPSLIGCLLLAVGTYLLFQNIVIFILSRCKKADKIYYKTGNFISISQLVYRIKANSSLFSAISLLSAFTISVLSGAIAFYIVIIQIMPVYNPFSYLCVNLDDSMRECVMETVEQDDSVDIKDVMEYDVLSTKANQENYRVDTNSGYGKISLEVGDEFEMDIIRLSDYKNILEATDARLAKGNMGATYVDTISENNCFFLDGNYDDTYSNGLIGKAVHVMTDEGMKDFNIQETSLHKYMGSTHGRTTLVINDKDFERFFNNKENYSIMHFLGYKFENQLETGDLYKKLNEIIPEKKRDDDYLTMHQLLFTIYGSYIFIGIFLGILFLMAAGSMIFYKQLMEARDDQKRYEILRKVGMTRKEVRNSVCRQLAVIFLLPFGVAVVHSFVILKAFENLVYTITTDIPVYMLALAVIAAYSVIYGVYYVLSVRGYMNTVWRRD